MLGQQISRQPPSRMWWQLASLDGLDQPGLFTARFTKLLVDLGVSSMRRMIITLAVVVCAAISSSNASAGLFCKKNACCEPAPVCCEAPAPTCCEPAPVCRPKLELGCKIKGMFGKLHSKLHKSSCCEPAPTCCDAPAPTCCDAPAPCAAPAPSCGCEVAAPSRGCEAPSCCKPARKHCIKNMMSHLKGKFASKKCCAPAPSCGCEVATPSCGCN